LGRQQQHKRNYFDGQFHGVPFLNNEHFSVNKSFRIGKLTQDNAVNDSARVVNHCLLPDAAIGSLCQ
jgi:hypothetical protein